MEGKSKIDIQHPEVWDLLLSIENRQVNYILYTSTVPGSLVIGQVECADESLQALEDAVLNTPELLGEYRRVSVIVHSNHFVLLPNDSADDDCAGLVRQAFPDDDGDVNVCSMPNNGVKIAFMLPRGLQAFLGRTLNYPAVYHHLHPLCEHFNELNRGHHLSRMFLHLNPQSMDVAIYREGKFVCANTYPFNGANDATYFALNAWRVNGLDQLTDELQLTGDRDTCAAMTPILRQYVKFVMPAVYPASAMRLGRNAMQAPLELILLALCE